jgi:hypothetical protein
MLFQREGAALQITITCEYGHRKVWWTSRRLQHEEENRAIYCAVNVLLPSCIVVSHCCIVYAYKQKRIHK